MSDDFDFDSLPRGLPRPVSDSDRLARGHWADPADLEESDRWSDASSSIVVGRNETGKLMCLEDDRHCFTVAGSRAGKGLSVILPNLARYIGSVCVLDPKGENATITAERRGEGRNVPAGGMGQEVHVIDPFRRANVHDSYRSGFNPLADLNPEDPMFIDECYNIADSLVIATAENTDSHWNSMARLVLRGFIAWVASSPDGKRDLPEVRRLIGLPPDDFDQLMIDMIKAKDRAFGVPREMAGTVESMGDEEKGSVFSTVRKSILFLASPAMAECLSDTVRQPDLKAWKYGGQSVYLCLPASGMALHARFFRLFINRIFSAVEADLTKPDVPALMILDEMHVLGHLKQIETAAGLLAGYGLKIWSIWQDMTQLQEIYGKRWQTFLGNSGLFQSFGLNDLESLKYVSDRLGPTIALSESSNQISVSQAVQGFTGESSAMTTTPLLSLDEVGFYFSRQSGSQAIVYPGVPPIWMKRVSWLDDDFQQYHVTDSVTAELEGQDNG